MKRLLAGGSVVLALAALNACSDDKRIPQREPVQSTSAVPDGTSGAALELASSIEDWQDDEGEYPRDRAEVENAIVRSPVAPLPTGTRLHSYYRLSQTPGFVMCVVNDNSGDYALYDSPSGSLVDEGTVEPGDDAAFTRVCSQTITD